MLFFLCFSVLKNDEAASMNIYVICMWHSTRNLRCRITNPFFFARFFPLLFVSFFLHRKRVDNTSCCNLYMYTHIYLINIFALFFPFVLSTKQKKKDPNAITFHCYCSMYDRDEMEMRTTKEEKNI